jgi:hypothetical protein
MFHLKATQFAATILGATAILLTAISSSSAALIEAIYTGTIYYGTDLSGVFGVPGRSLAGDTYVATFLFDTTRGNSQSSPTSNEVSGGSAFGTLSPVLEVVVEVNGYRASFPAPYLGLIGGSNDGVSSSQNAEAYRNETDGSIGYSDGANFQIKIDGSSIPSSIIGPFTYNVSNNDSDLGSFNFDTYDYILGYPTYYAYADVHISTLTVSGVPELSTWVMMLLGFSGLGLAGVSARRLAMRCLS